MIEGGKLELRKPKYFLDTGAIALYFAGIPEIRRYVTEAAKGLCEVYTSELNMAELYYKIALKLGEDTAKIYYASLRNSSINIVSITEEYTLEAAKLKLRYYNVLSLADCYVIAISRYLGAKIVTTDEKIKDVYKKTIVIKP